jgi:diacylglycerol kinase (ATP)
LCISPSISIIINRYHRKRDIENENRISYPCDVIGIGAAVHGGLRPVANMKRILVVLNPGAIGRDYAALQRALERHISEAGLAYDVYETSRDERIDETVRNRVREEYDAIVVAGGDGTVSGAAGGLTDTSVPLGIIPMGTGNILARELEIPLDIDDAARLISGSHRIRTIDAMRLDGRTFFLNIGVGISALTVRDTTREHKSRFGRLAYVWTAVQKAFQFHPHRFTVTVDDELIHMSSPDVSIANSGILGDMLLPEGPDISIDDGVLNVCYIKAKSVMDYPAFVMNIIGRRPLQRSVICLEARSSVTIESEQPLAVQADGEIAGRTPVTVRVLPHAIGVIVPLEP